jgi:hypothetical protein
VKNGISDRWTTEIWVEEEEKLAGRGRTDRKFIRLPVLVIASGPRLS